MKKILLTLILGMFLITLVSASDLGTIKQNDCVSLYQFCDDCPGVNFTAMKYPNGTIDTSLNELMTKTNQNFNYSFCNTSELGEYFYTVCGIKSGTYTCEALSFEVTPTGFLNTLGFYFLILILSGGIIIFGYSIKDATVVILGAMALIFVALYLLFNGIVGIQDKVYTWAISIILLCISFYLLVRGSEELLQ